MAEEQGFAQARARLEEIVVQVRKKDTSLEQSLDLLEEGVRLANQCTELVDHAEWKSSEAAEGDAESKDVGPNGASSLPDHGAVGASDAAEAGPPAQATAADDADAAPTESDRGSADRGSDESAEDEDEYADIFADE